MKTPINVTVEWERPEGFKRHVHVYYLNGERISTLFKVVALRIRATIAVPNRLIRKACLSAKELDCGMVIFFTPNGWRVRRSF